MSYNFFVIGGDLRIFYLAKKLQREENNVKVYGFDKIPKDDFFNEHIEIAKSLNELKKDDIIISSIPLSFDDKNIYAPYTDEKIPLETLAFHHLIAGKITKDTIYNIYKSNINYVENIKHTKDDIIEIKTKSVSLKIFDVLKDEKTTILNTIPTAEGAIAKAIQEFPQNINDTNVLVTGFGNVGKTLAYKLKQLGANVYVEARKEKDLAWARVYGYNPVHLTNLKENICKINLIFNTVPHLIIDKDILVLMNKNVLIIDISSSPGGVDFESAKKMGIKAYMYSGIPGKISPKSVGDYILEYITKNVTTLQNNYKDYI